uniref:Outer capsid protein VP2 n=2 Tax=Palyam virus TaxID=40059 RepID=A0A7R7ZFJ3_9REOV|nr:outer capsid protein VP2 [Bunyip Creek virus]BCR31589.1 VP2 protein [Palyam virus]
MDEFSVARIRRFEEDRLAYILLHEVSVDDENKVNRLDDEQNQFRQRRGLQQQVLWDETLTHQRKGLYQHAADLDMIKSWNMVEGDGEKRTFPRHPNLLDIVLRSQNGGEVGVGKKGKENGWYKRIPLSVQLEEDVYSQIHTYFDYECGKISVEPYCGRAIMSPQFADQMMFLRGVVHSGKCHELNVEILYEALLRGHFSIEVPNQKGVGRAYSIITNDRGVIEIGQGGISSSIFQSVKNNRSHPLTQIYESMLVTFNVKRVLISMQNYALRSYGTYDEILSDYELEKRLEWRIKLIESFEREGPFKRQFETFKTEWTRKLEERRAVIDSEAVFSVYDGELATLRDDQKSKYGQEISTQGAQWQAYKEILRSRSKTTKVLDWLEWIYLARYLGRYPENIANFEPFERERLEEIANEARHPWMRRILYVVAAIIIEEGGCVTLGRRKWYSTILQACIDLNPRVLDECRQKLNFEVSCGLEATDPTTNLGSYSERDVLSVSYVEMQWVGDQMLDGNEIDCTDVDVLDSNEESFIATGWSAVSKNTDSYFNDIKVHDFPQLSKFEQKGRNILVTLKRDEEWNKPKRFSSYMFRIKIEDSVKIRIGDHDVYEVKGRKYPYPFSELGPHTRTYMLESMLTGQTRIMTKEPNEKWLWIKNEFQQRGAQHRVGSEWEGCGASEWSHIYLNEMARLLQFTLRRICEVGPHPPFSKFEDDKWLDSMNYHIDNLKPRDLCDAISMALVKVCNFPLATREQLFYIAHSINKVEAMIEVFPKIRNLINDHTVISFYSLNIIPILLTVIPYGRIVDNHIPIIIHTDVGMRVIPGSTYNVKSGQNMSDWLMYLESVVDRRQGSRNLTNHEREVKSAFLRYYEHVIIKSRFSRAALKYKLEMLESWVGINCSGYFDSMVQVVPIRSPKKGFVLLILSDDTKPLAYIHARLLRMFSHVWTSCRGIHIIDVRKGELADGCVGDSRVVQYRRIDMDQSVDVWVLTAPNATFGNKHMITKLLSKVG